MRFGSQLPAETPYHQSFNPKRTKGFSYYPNANPAWQTHPNVLS